MRLRFVLFSLWVQSGKFLLQLVKPWRGKKKRINKNRNHEKENKLHVYFLISKQGEQFLCPRFKLSRPCRHWTLGDWNCGVQVRMSAIATGTPKCNDTIGLKIRNNRVARTARAARILVKFLDEFCKKQREKKKVSTTTWTYNSKSFDL